MKLFLRKITRVRHRRASASVHTRSSYIQTIMDFLSHFYVPETIEIFCRLNIFHSAQKREQMNNKFIRRTIDVLRFISHPLNANQPIDDWRKVMVGLGIKLFTLKIWFKKHCSILVPILRPDVRRPKSSRCQKSCHAVSVEYRRHSHCKRGEKKLKVNVHLLEDVQFTRNWIPFRYLLRDIISSLIRITKIKKNIEDWREEDTHLDDGPRQRRRRQLGYAILWIWR